MAVTITTLSSREFNQDTSRAKKADGDGPVFITDRGVPAHESRPLAGLGRLARVSLGFRQDYPAAATEGKAAVEFATTKSADEVKQLRSYVFNLLRHRHGKAAC
jgi:hypothetical protein